MTDSFPFVVMLFPPDLVLVVRRLVIFSDARAKLCGRNLVFELACCGCHVA